MENEKPQVPKPPVTITTDLPPDGIWSGKNPPPAGPRPNVSPIGQNPSPAPKKD